MHQQSPSHHLISLRKIIAAAAVACTVTGYGCAIAWAEEPEPEAPAVTVQIISPSENTGITEGKSITFKTNLSAGEASQYAADWRVDDAPLTRCAAMPMCEIGAGFAPGSHTVSVAVTTPKGISSASRTLWILGSPRVAFVGDKAGSVEQGKQLNLRIEAAYADSIDWQLRTVGTYSFTGLPACTDSTECAVGDGLTPGSYEVLVTARNEQVLKKATDRFTLTVVEPAPAPDPEPEPSPEPGPSPDSDPGQADPGYADTQSAGTVAAAASTGSASSLNKGSAKTLANTGAENAAVGISLLLFGLAGAFLAAGTGGRIIRKIIAQ